MNKSSWMKYYFITRKKGKREEFLCSNSNRKLVWRKRCPENIGSAVMYAECGKDDKLKSLRSHGRNGYRYDCVFAFWRN